MTHEEMTKRLLSGFWVWAGDYVVGCEKEGAFVAVHGKGTSHITQRWDDNREAAAHEIISRVILSGKRDTGFVAELVKGPTRYEIISTAMSPKDKE